MPQYAVSPVTPSTDSGIVSGTPAGSLFTPNGAPVGDATQ